MINEMLFIFPYIIQIIVLLILPLTNDLWPLNPSLLKDLLKSNYSWHRIYRNTVRCNKKNLNFLLPSTHKMRTCFLSNECHVFYDTNEGNMGLLKCQQYLEIILESGLFLALFKKCSGSGCLPLTGIVRVE